MIQHQFLFTNLEIYITFIIMIPCQYIHKKNKGELYVEVREKEKIIIS